MDLPDAQRRMPILAEHIQKLSNAIKQNRIRPGLGYYLKETNSGTSLVFPSSMIGGSGGGGVACPFEVTDASEGNTLKVQIGWGLIWQMLPTGMFPDNDPPLRLTITETCYIYSNIVFNTNTLLPSEVKFTVESELKSNTATTQYNLVATVTVSESEPKTITSIRNICQQPFPSPCSLS
jgi:hypothetical protein